MSNHIVANQLRTPKGILLRSYNRHDYVTYPEDGKVYMVDGGLDYLRRSCHGDEQECSVFDDDPFRQVRTHLVWGTYGKDGDQPFRWIPLSEMETDHIWAVLHLDIPQWRKDLMLKELDWRGK